MLIEEFRNAPFEELLNRCSEKQLWKIAELHDLNRIDKRLRKDELRKTIKQELSDLQILPNTSKRVIAAAVQSPSVICGFDI